MALALNVAKGAGKDMVNQMKGKLGGNKINVDWNDFNYPPLLRIIHYDIDELESDLDLKKLVRMLFLSHISMVTLTILNLVSNIIQTASIEGQGMRILYSILWFLLINPVHGYWFYIGYKGSVESSSLVSQCGRFKIGGFVLIIIYLLWSILDNLMFNGWVRVSDLFKHDHGGIGVICLVENILIYLLIAAMFFIMWKVHMRNM